MNVVILGASSGIAAEMARLYAARGADFGLLGSSAERLAEVSADLHVRGAGRIRTLAIDLAAPAPYETIISDLAAELGGIDVFILAYGILGDQARAHEDLQHAAAILVTDFTSAALWLLAAAKCMSRNGSGTIAVFCSVAGDRGRRSNYVYGSAKAGLAVFAQGMAHELAASGPRIVIVKPGFVITPMTAGMNRAGPLWSEARRVARIVTNAIDRKRGPVIYVPWFWRWIMLIIRLVPAPIFHRTKL